VRALATAERIERFLTELGRSVRKPTAVYLAGGATAVLHGWRESTVDVDLKLVPDSDQALRAIPRLKRALDLNVELAAPDQFIPEVPGWRERSEFIRQEGAVSFYHYDLYSQALAKIERRHRQDLEDVASMLAAGRIDPAKLLALFDAIEPQLYRFPAVDPGSFRRAVVAVAAVR
jgi:hypothetical protein